MLEQMIPEVPSNLVFYDSVILYYFGHDKYSICS